MFQLLGVFAELERSIITERINAGIARAQAAGKHCGLLRGGKGILKVAREVGVGTGTVQRALDPLTALFFRMTGPAGGLSMSGVLLSSGGP
jgi:DNA invertase Pin-like site-specific DNA recombinase